MIEPHYRGRIVDAHHHFWDLADGGHYPWLQDEYDTGFFLGDYSSLRMNFLPEQYRNSTRGYEIVADVHIEAERSRREQVTETEFLTTLAERSGMPSVIVGHVGFTQPDRDEVLAAHAAHPLVRGVRSKPVTADSAGGLGAVRGVPGSMQDYNWRTGLAQLERYGLSWDLRVPAWHLHEAADALSEVPDLTVILNHCGLPLDRSKNGLRLWLDGMRHLAELPNVNVKVSELGLRGGVWDCASNVGVIRDVVEVFGWDRVMFGSNLPVSSLAVSFHDFVGTVAIALADADEEELDRFFAQNAARVYRIRPQALRADLSIETRVS